MSLLKFLHLYYQIYKIIESEMFSGNDQYIFLNPCVDSRNFPVQLLSIQHGH